MGSRRLTDVLWIEEVNRRLADWHDLARRNKIRQGQWCVVVAVRGLRSTAREEGESQQGPEAHPYILMMWSRILPDLWPARLK